MNENEIDELKKSIKLQKIMDTMLVPIIIPAAVGLFFLTIAIFILIFSVLKVLFVGIINLLN